MKSSALTPSVVVPATASGANNPAGVALIVGIVGVLIGLGGIFWGVSKEVPDPRPLIGWLIGFAFWFAMSIGMTYQVMLYYLFDAGWSIIVRRQLEHFIGSFRVLAVCFLPLLLVALFGRNPGLLWPWRNPDMPLPVLGGETIAEDPLFIWKHAYFALPFFLLRLAIYASVFIGLAYQFRKNSFAMDKDANPQHVLNCRKWSAFGVIAVSMAATFAAFDFFMSLSYQWFSTMYGVWFFATSMRCGFAGTVILCYFLSNKPGRPLYGIYNRAHQYLLGCLCLTFTIFWAYITFCQYFLIYNADIPEETFWFNVRELGSDWLHNSWWWVSLALIFGYFFLPFFALLSYNNKVKRKNLLVIAFWILSFHLLDLYFNILPAKLPSDANVLGFTVREFRPSIWDVSSLVGIGGLVIWAFLKSRPQAEDIPIHDPRIEESLHYHE